MTYIKQSIVSTTVYPLCQRGNEGIDSEPLQALVNLIVVCGIQFQNSKIIDSNCVPQLFNNNAELMTQV